MTLYGSKRLYLCVWECIYICTYMHIYVKTIKETKAMNLEGVHGKDWRNEKKGK